MNVANMMTTIGAPGGVSVSGMTASTQEFGGLGSLFAMQMGNAMQSLQQSDLPVGQTGEIDGEDVKQLSELLAMIQQLLASHPMQQPDVIKQMEEKWNALQHVMSKLPQPAALLPEDSKRLIATFTQQGLSQERASKLVDLLASLSKAGESATLTSGQQQVAKQLQDIFAQLSVQPPKETARGGAGERKAEVDRIPPVKTPFRSQSDTRTLVQAETARAVQPLRVSQAISAYQAEAGLRIRSGAAMAEQQVQTLVQPGRDSEAGPTMTPIQVPTPTLHALSGQVIGQSLAQAGSGHIVHANHFTQQVTDLFVKQMKVATVNGVNEAKLILYPQSLGQVDVTITSQNGVITAHFSAETANGKELLDNQLPQLRAALTQQGLQVDKLEVTQQQTQSFSFQQQKEQSRQQQDGRQQRQPKEEQAEFSIDAWVDRTESISALWNRLRNAAGIEYSA
jgi:flagellar hook-length control protein FliK